jgi:Phosphotransferase enzyme family
VARVAGVKAATLEARLQGLWGGYGEVLRVELDGSRRAIVKRVRPPRDDGSLSHRRKLRSYEVERAFYARYSARCQASPECRVARPYGVLATDGGWLFVLEDLDASGFSERRSQASDEDVRATLRWLARFHARFLGVAPDELWKVGTYWHLATRPEELRAVADEALRGAAGRIDDALGRARFRTLVHGDAKLENVCFAADASRVALVDFQYVGGGVGVKDVAYFLSSCLSASECERRVPVYVDCYFQELAVALGAAAAPVEREWRALFPFAWVDFHRFYSGWAPTAARGDAYSERLTRDVLFQLKSG